MTAPLTLFVVEYRCLGAADLAALNAAVLALMATDPYWQPWGSVSVTTGAGDTHHQAMVRYGSLGSP